MTDPSPDSVRGIKTNRSRWRPRFLLLYGLFLLFGLAFLFLVSEAFIRLVVPEQYWRLYVAQDDWLPDPLLGWRNKPNLNVSRRFESELVAFTTNPDGLQVARSFAESGEAAWRIMIFGDSTVVGRAVAEEGRLHHQLARRLAARGTPAEVINAGVEGYSTDQSLLAMESLIPRYHPQVVIHMVCANDFAGNLRATNYGVPKPRFILSDQGRLDLAMPRLETSPLAQEKTRLLSRSTLQKSALYRMLQPALVRIRKAVGGPSAAALAQGDDMSPSPALLQEVNWAHFEALVARMREVCITNGAALLLTQHPSVGEVQHIKQANSPLEAKLLGTAKACGVRFSPVIAAARKAHQHGILHLLPRDAHCNASGYALVADALDEAIRNNFFLGETGKNAFETK